MQASTKQHEGYKIARATLSNSNEVFNILSTCADWLSQKGMGHWKGAFTKEKVEKRISEREVYLIYGNSKAVGTITLDVTPPFHHLDGEKGFWDDSNVRAMYVRALAVLPSHHEKGLATKLMKFAEEKAIEKGIHTIRFTAVANYKELTRFYLKRGFGIIGKGQVVDDQSNFFEKIV